MQMQMRRINWMLLLIDWAVCFFLKIWIRRPLQGTTVVNKGYDVTHRPVPPWRGHSSCCDFEGCCVQTFKQDCISPLISFGAALKSYHGQETTIQLMRLLLDWLWPQNRPRELVEPPRWASIGLQLFIGSHFTTIRWFTICNYLLVAFCNYPSF